MENTTLYKIETSDQEEMRMYLQAGQYKSELVEIFNLSRNALKHEQDLTKCLEQINSIAAHALED